MLVELTSYLAGVLLLIGTLFSILAAIGVARLPDLYTRMHAASKAGVVGAGFVFLAIVAASLDGPVILRAIIGLIFLLLTTPLSAHLLARAAYLTGHRPTPLPVVNQPTHGDSN